MKHQPNASTLPRREAYSVHEARQLLGGLSKAGMYRLIRGGQLRTFCIGRRRFIGADAISDFIAKSEREAADLDSSEREAA